jgi:hypothetical protein
VYYRVKDIICCIVESGDQWVMGRVVDECRKWVQMEKERKREREREGKKEGKGEKRWDIVDFLEGLVKTG